jgi:hypothetical protein
MAMSTDDIRRNYDAWSKMLKNGASNIDPYTARMEEIRLQKLKEKEAEALLKDMKPKEVEVNPDSFTAEDAFKESCRIKYTYDPDDYKKCMDAICTYIAKCSLRGEFEAWVSLQTLSPGAQKQVLKELKRRKFWIRYDNNNEEYIIVSWNARKHIAKILGYVAACLFVLFVYTAGVVMVVNANQPPITVEKAKR